MGDLSLVSPVLLKQYVDWVGLWEPEISHSEWCCENKSLFVWEYLHRTADVGSPCRAPAAMFTLLAVGSVVGGSQMWLPVGCVCARLWRYFSWSFRQP